MLDGLSLVSRILREKLTAVETNFLLRCQSRAERRQGRSSPQSTGTEVALLDVTFCSTNDTFQQKTLPIITHVASGSGPPKPVTSVPKTRKHPLVFPLLFWEH